MTLNISPNHFVIFDLDDTLYKEVDFLKSAYKHIAKRLEIEISNNIYEEMLALWFNKESVFDVIKKKYSFKESISDLVFEYRYHKPEINLSFGALKLLRELKKYDIQIGLLTDGRSKSQRNKIISLGIEHYFSKILISEEYGSEKPSLRNFQYFKEESDSSYFVYIGDNYSKDFVSPNKLGWMTIGLLDDGRNIHKQSLNLDKRYLPKKTIQSLTEIKLIFSL